MTIQPNNTCEGWIQYSHETDAALTKVRIHGCVYRGGAECGDSGDTIYLCPKCLHDLQADDSMVRDGEPRYTVLGRKK